MLGKFLKNYKIVTKGSGSGSGLHASKPMNIKGEQPGMRYGTVIASA
jgi:hypothetical protein